MAATTIAFEPTCWTSVQALSLIHISQVLIDLGIRKMRLMSNNPAKRAGLMGHGLEIVEFVPIVAEPNDHSGRYLETKKEKLGHLLP